MDIIRNDLTEWFTGFERAVIVGVGNPLRRDDGVGVEVVNRLKGKISNDKILLIESENVPESFIEPIVEFNPSHILIIDAALIGLKSGSTKLTDSSLLSRVAVSTHALPIQIFCTYLTQVTGSKIGLLLIQPKNVDFGEGLSSELKRVVKRVIDVLTSILL